MTTFFYVCHFGASVADHNSQVARNCVWYHLWYWCHL